MTDDDDAAARGLKSRGRRLKACRASGRGVVDTTLLKPRRFASLDRRKSYRAEYDGVQKANKAGAVCRHCAKTKVNRPRGLCRTCYYTPGLKELYPPTSRYARRGAPNFAGEAAPCEPTDALPGTPEKIAVLAERARLGQVMHHPRDAKYTLEDPPSLEQILPADPCEFEEVA